MPLSPEKKCLLLIPPTYYTLYTVATWHIFSTRQGSLSACPHVLVFNFLLFSLFPASSYRFTMTAISRDIRSTRITENIAAAVKHTDCVFELPDPVERLTAMQGPLPELTELANNFEPG
jgi:hypothetical protein